MSLDKYVVEVNRDIEETNTDFREAFVIEIISNTGGVIMGATYGRDYQGAFIGRLDSTGIIFNQTLTDFPERELNYEATEANPRKKHSYSGTYRNGDLKGDILITRLDQFSNAEMALLRSKVEFPEV